MTNDVGNWLENLGLGQYAAAFIENDVFEPVFGGEIDIVFIGVIIDSGPEINTIDIVCIPPVPGDFARLDPAGVPDLAGAGQTKDEIGVGQFNVFAGDLNRAPREGAVSCARGSRNMWSIWAGRWS